MYSQRLSWTGCWLVLHFLEQMVNLEDRLSFSEDNVGFFVSGLVV